MSILSNQCLQPFLGDSRDHRSRLRPAATAAAVYQRRPTRRSLPAARAAAAAAAAGGARAGGAAQLDGIVPYLNSNAAHLKGRQLPDNPAQWLWQAAANAALRGELLFAACIDRHAAAAYIMSALAGVMISLGLDAATLLQHGLPPYLPDLLLRFFGAWDTSLWAAALTAAALPLTAWAVRAWWAANLMLLGDAASSVQQIWQQQQRQRQRSAQASGQTDQQQQQQEGTDSLEQQRDSSSSSDDSHWVAAAVTVLRAACLTSAANSFIGVLYGTQAATTSAATAISIGAGVAAVLVAAASLLALQQRNNTNSSSSSSSSSSRTLAAVLAAEAAWLCATVGLGPFVGAAAAVVLAGSLYLMQSAAVAPALLQYKAAAGDAVEVHVSLKLAGTRPVFDSTLAEEPLSVEVRPVPQEVLQLWEAAALADFDNTAQQKEQQQEKAADGSSSSGSGGSDSPIVTPSLDQVQKDIQSWMARPSARWEALKPYAAHAAEGLFLGQQVSVPLHNPKVVGYWNPTFTWWQPTAEVMAKFKGSMPSVGDVFWYPVADGAAVPTRVNVIGKDYVELDANYGVTDTGLELQVQLVRLNKPTTTQQQQQQQQ